MKRNEAKSNLIYSLEGLCGGGVSRSTEIELYSQALKIHF